MLGTCCVCGDIGQIDSGSSCGGKLDLGLFGSFLKSLHSHLVAAEVDSLDLLEFAEHPVDDPLVEVIAA